MPNTKADTPAMAPQRYLKRVQVRERFWPQIATNACEIYLVDRADVALWCEPQAASKVVTIAGVYPFLIRVDRDTGKLVARCERYWWPEDRLATMLYRMGYASLADLRNYLSIERAIDKKPWEAWAIYWGPRHG